MPALGAAARVQRWSESPRHCSSVHVSSLSPTRTQKLSSLPLFLRGTDSRRLCNIALNAHEGGNHCILRHRWYVSSSWDTFHVSLQDKAWEMVKLYPPSPKNFISHLQFEVQSPAGYCTLLFYSLELCCHQENLKLPKWSSKCNCRKSSQAKGPS